MNNITIDPNIRFGKPIIQGTRIAVEDILNLLKAGLSINEILKEYSHLTKEQIISAIDYAGKVVSNEDIAYVNTHESA